MFLDILEWKNAFLHYKNNKFKKVENCDFSKGIVNSFDQKFAIFPSFYLREKRTAECVSRHYRMKKRLFRLKKNKVKKSRKIVTLPKGIVYGFGEKLATDPFFLFPNWTRKMFFTIC